MFFPFVGMPFFPFLLFGIAAAAVYVFQYQKRQSRVRAISMLAGSIGFEFSFTDQWGLETMPFSLFRQGQGQKATNIVYGRHNDLPLSMFDYEYYIQGRS